MRNLRLDYICLTSLLYIYDGNEDWISIIQNNNIGYDEALLILINKIEEFINKSIENEFFKTNIYEIEESFYEFALEQARNIYNYNI